LEIKIGSKIHNRFDIEVIDSKTGQLKQRGQAENIILDRMYTRLCNFNSYFDYIHFGQGTGVVDPSRNILFDEIGYKSAVTEETIKDYPISRWTRKIVLNPEEYVGKSITEVGISDVGSSTKSSSYINTHALIKDAEGNQLSIEKTDTDVVIIYATVFIELQNKSENIQFCDIRVNSLLDYLTGSSISTPSLSIGPCEFASRFSSTYVSANNTPTVSIDVLNKKRIYKTRFGISSGNNSLKAIREICLNGVFNCSLPETSVFTNYNLEEIPIGIGDGVTAEFEIPHESVKSMKVKVDGSVVTNYEYQSGLLENVLRGISDFGEVIWFSNRGIYNGFNGDLYRNTGTYSIYTSEAIIERKKSMSEYIAAVYGSWGQYGAARAEIFLSNDMEEWAKLTTITASTNPFTQYVLPETIDSFKYIKFVLSAGNGSVRIDILPPSNGPKNTIIFNTPPSEGTIITADYTVPYIPKTADYVLDVTAEIQFGEGV
jgi:hypothetical protein